MHQYFEAGAVPVIWPEVSLTEEKQQQQITTDNKKILA